MTYYPVYLNLYGKRIVVIGGGNVAERKVVSLIGSEATITVISPGLTIRLAALAKSDLIQWHERSFRSGDCRDADLIFSATGDPSVDEAVFKEARAERTLLNTADQPAHCDFIMPAIVRRGELTVAISTGGASPALASRLRRKLSRILGPEYGRLLALLASVRPEIRNRIRDAQSRKELHYRILRSPVLHLLRQHDAIGAERLVQETIKSFTPTTESAE